MSELAFSFTECAPVPQDPQLVIPAAESGGAAVISVRNSGKTAYSFMEKAARKFRGWLTVTVFRFFREIIRTVLRIFCETVDRAAFKRNIYIREGVFRL